MKVCRICEVAKPLDEFGSHARHSDGKQNYCKPCRNALNRDLLTPEQKATKKRNAQRYALVEDRKVRRRGYRYNLSPAEFEAMNTAQNGRCAICGGTETYEHRTLCVDHDHATGAVRGLLCTRCNKALGGFQDSPDLLMSAVAYLLTQVDVFALAQQEGGS